ncbi:MAG: hypothetical protein J6336_02230 [Kiritimatiellae bacterium]|nr:hypothetical protein [Kiritimatiellia bacterium]
MTFGSVLLPAGGSLYDYVTLTGGEDQGHFFTLSADGTELHVNDPNAAVTAEWIGGEGADPADPASWICRNQDNAVVDGVVPAHSTVSVTFTKDGDLRALGPVTFAENTTFDLNGHVVRIAAFTGPGYSLTSVINSAESDTAELHVDVANGKTLTNDTTLISGNVKLVKDGAGTLSVAKSGQSYTGGTEIADGIFETLPVKHFSPERHLLGSNGNTTTVRTGARFRLNALYGEADADYRFVLDGGTMEGCGEDLPNGWGQFHHIELTANSTFIVTTHTGMRPGGSFRATTIDLGGYTLTVQIGTNGKIFYLYDTTILNGMLDVTSGGWLEIGKIYTDGMAAQDVDIRVGSALRINASASVRNYEQVYGSDNNNGTGELNVYGTFTPAASHNYFYGCTMRDGSTIDLSGKTGTWSTKSAFSNGRNTVTFASGATVTIKLEGRGDLRELSKSASPYVVTWPTDENGITDVPENVTFTPDAWTLQNRYLLRQDATGLRLLYSAGTVIIVR